MQGFFNVYIKIVMRKDMFYRRVQPLTTVERHIFSKVNAYLYATI
jgi:hypothetical protein